MLGPCFAVDKLASRAVNYARALATDVHCPCGAAYCFACDEAPHAPLLCSQVGLTPSAVSLVCIAVLDLCVSADSPLHVLAFFFFLRHAPTINFCSFVVTCVPPFLQKAKEWREMSKLAVSEHKSEL